MHEPVNLVIGNDFPAQDITDRQPEITIYLVYFISDVQYARNLYYREEDNEEVEFEKKEMEGNPINNYNDKKNIASESCGSGSVFFLQKVSILY